MKTTTISKGMSALMMAMSLLCTNKMIASNDSNVHAATTTCAQALKKPTLEDLIPGGETFRRTENKWYQWYGDKAVLELGIESITGTWTSGKKAGQSFTALTLEEVNRLLAEKNLGKLHHFYTTEAVNGSVEGMEPAPLLLLHTGKHRILVNWEEKQILHSIPCPEGAANEDYHTTRSRLAYTIGNNLYMQESDGTSVQITHEPEGIVCGQSVHRNEFGISKGTFWNADGTLLAFYRMDESMVTSYPLVDITARVGQVNAIRYPMAGMTSHKVQVGIFNPANGKTIYLNTGDATDRYFTNISWAPDGKSLFLIELNRDQNHSKLCQYNAENGELIQVLYEEEHEKYVEPQHAILFLPWDDSKFIYQSQRDGFNHLYVFDLKKKKYPERYITKAGTTYRPFYENRQLTTGNWLVQDVLGFDVKRKEIIFAATKESPLQNNIYKVNVKNGKITSLDNGQGVHRVQLSANAEYMIDNYSTPDTPRRIVLTSLRNGKECQELLVAKNPFEGLQMPNIETGILKAADGTTDLHYRIVKPADFDPNKKYPAIVYVYGGPHAQLITNGFMHDARGWDLYMANEGYILFTVDNRGSANRGMEFENATFRHLGIEEGKDQVKGVEFLKTLPYVDGNRIGVHGWSFGGHMTTALLLRYPEIFKVGVAGGPVIDWGYYEVMYGERYMDTPQTNPEGYQETNLKNLAGNLKGHLLIIHDDHDDTCVPQHTLSFMKACVDARTYPDLFIYPNHKHNVIGRDRVHLHEKITRYFKANL